MVDQRQRGDVNLGIRRKGFLCWGGCCPSEGLESDLERVGRDWAWVADEGSACDCPWRPELASFPHLGTGPLGEQERAADDLR